MEKEKYSPLDLLLALMDSFDEPLCLIDSNGHSFLNEYAKQLQNNGLDIDNISKRIKVNSTETVTHKGVLYSIEKKEMNHGTNSCVCKFVPEDDTIKRLTESSKKLKKVLSAF